jgi:hypothetical protein
MTSRTIKSVRLTDAEIIRDYQAGALLRELLHPLDASQQEVLQRQLAVLHNSGSIDLLALTATPEFQNLDGRHRFTVQQIYRNAIPLLEATPLAMLEMVRRLETQGGVDGIAALPRSALRIWIGQASERAKEIIEVARSDPSFDREILMDALVSHGDASSAISFLAVADPRRQAAIAALGSIKPRNPKAGDATLGKLVAIAASDPEEDMRFTAISAAFDLLLHCKPRAPQWVPALVKAVTAKPSDTTRAALLHGLWRHTELFQSADAEAALSLACAGDLTAARLVETLGGTLYQLVGGVHHDLAIDCLTAVLSSSGKAIPLDKLQMLEHRLTALDRPMLFAIAVRWFATGDQALCETISKLIGGVQDQQPFDASLAGFGLTGNQMIVLCHKAVGYMPLAPIVAASVVVAALRAGDKDPEPELVQLLLHALLINFRETVANYLKKIGKADVSYRAVRMTLKMYRRYEKDSDIKTPIKELQPSSYQRGVVRQNHYIANREIRKQAERQSIFFGSVHRSTLLYGRRAITYARGADEPPTSMEMKEMSTYIEMPRLQTIDPVGLGWLFHIYRSSKPK